LNPLELRNQRMPVGSSLMLGIMLLAFAIQLYQLDARTFHGDELGSLDEARRLGLNINSIPYFGALHVWIGLGTSEFWTRFPSILAAVLGIAVSYAWIKRLASQRAALVVCLLLATSPFLIVYSQQVRFYALAFLASGLSILAFVTLLNRGTAHSGIIWIASTIFAVAALLLNSLLVLSQLVTGFLLTPRLANKQKTVLLTGLVVLIAVLLLLPQVRATGFDALAAYTNAKSHYEASRGLSWTQVAKIPLTFFFFVLGESVYPFNFWLVVPGIFVFGCVFGLGLLRLRDNRTAFLFVVTTILTALALLYLVFDPLSPATLQGAAPRYLIFLLPLFYLIVASGTTFRFARWLVFPLLLVNLLGLVAYWAGDWSYTDDLINWREVKSIVAENYTGQSDLVLDGRSREYADFYFPSDWHSFDVASYVPNSDKQRVILLSNDFHAERRQEVNDLITTLGSSFSLTSAWSHYPLFIYVFDRDSKPRATFRVQASGRVDLPIEAYGLEFQDLHLPAVAHFGTNAVPVYGSFALPASPGNSKSMPLAQPQNAKRVWLLSNVIGATGTDQSTPIAELTIHFTAGMERTFPIQLGVQTGTWDGECNGQGCQRALTWDKRMALLGLAAYPGSWREFSASIFAFPFVWNENKFVQSIELRPRSSGGVLYVWGIDLEQ